MTAGTSSSALDLLDVALRRCLAAGVLLTDGVRDFMSATFGDDTIDTLRILLSDDSSAERDSLLDLVFFPDEPLQMAIEPVLIDHGFREKDVSRLAERLKADPAAVRLSLPGSNDTVPASMPVFVVDAFLARLNLTWQPVDVLKTALARLDAGLLAVSGKRRDGHIWLRVQLRNAALRQTPIQIGFLCDFFERLPLNEPDFVDKLAFMLVFLNEHGDSTNLYQALMDRKKFLFQHRLKARRAAELAARSNMETLIMTGVRSPHFDVAAAERNLALIDSIALAVFGRTEWLGSAPVEVDLGGSDGSLDPEDLVKKLS